MRAVWMAMLVLLVSFAMGEAFDKICVTKSYRYPWQIFCNGANGGAGGGEYCPVAHFEDAVTITDLYYNVDLDGSGESIQFLPYICDANGAASCTGPTLATQGLEATNFTATNTEQNDTALTNGDVTAGHDLYVFIDKSTAAGTSCTGCPSCPLCSLTLLTYTYCYQLQ